MSVIATRRVAYSADTAGDTGRVAVTVIRGGLPVGARMTYSIALRNESGSDAHLCARLDAVDDVPERAIVQSLIAPYADFSTSIEIDVRTDGSVPAVRVDVAAGDIALTLLVPSAAVLPAFVTPNGSGSHALAPRPAFLTAMPEAMTLRPVAAPVLMRETVAAAPPTRAHGSPSVAPVLALFAVIIGAVGYALGRPQIAEFVVPSTADAARPVPIVYRATGIGNVTFRVVGPDAVPIADGTLPAGAGSFEITAPRARENRAYLVRVAIDGPLGTTDAESYLRVPAAIVRPPAPAPHPLAAPPQIRSLAVDRAELAGGTTLNVYYDVAATSGDVALLDAATQIPYGKSALDPTGHTAFVVPSGDTQRNLTVVLTAQRGGTSAQSRVAVSVTPVASPTPSADPGAAATAGTIPVSPPQVTVPSHVVAGQPIRVAIANASSPLELLLTNADDSAIARRDVGAAPSVSVFTAPLVTRPTSIRLTVSYAMGAGQETIVDDILVTPR